MANRPVPAKELELLRQFDTPTISNVIELFDAVPRNRGYMDHRIRCNFPELPPMVGFASTAAFRSDARYSADVSGNQYTVQSRPSRPQSAILRIRSNSKQWISHASPNC